MILALLILLLAISLGAAGQILLKAGLNHRFGPADERPSPVAVVGAIFTTPMIFGGLSCYAVSSLFYLFALSRLPLSYAYPLIALSYVFVTFLAWLLLKETVPPARIAGLAVILAGVMIFALTYTDKPAQSESLPPPPESRSLQP